MAGADRTELNDIHCCSFSQLEEVDTPAQGIDGGTGSPEENGFVLLLLLYSNLLALEPFQGLHACMKIL